MAQRTLIGSLRPAVLTGLLLAGLLFLTGCNLMAYPIYLILGGNEKTVKAQYTGLAGKTIAIVIAADPAIDAGFPQARDSLSLAMARLIGDRVKKTRFIGLDQVEQFEMHNLEWYALPMSQVGQALGAERVLYVDLFQYDMYEPGSVQLLRGQIAAVIKVYEMESERPNSPAYKGQVMIQYPANAPQAASDTALLSVTQRSVMLFADKAANKFCKHKEIIARENR